MIMAVLSVRKRDHRCEPFSADKLAGSMRRAMAGNPDALRQTAELSKAIEIYLRRQRKRIVSSAAVFEMTLKALRRVHQGPAAEVMEMHRSLRCSRRRLLRVSQEDGQITRWDKSWLAKLATTMWGVSNTTGRILAGDVEMELLPQEPTIIPREKVLGILNDQVVAVGLADAVPVR
jgi:hypothetical protein